MQDPVHEIKSKLAIEDVVAPYVQLKRAGKYLKGLCPFHQEKSASFFVSPERQIAYCFSCNKGGDHFAFIQEIEGLSFREALELLAEKANVELPKNSSGAPRVSKDLKDRLYEANAKASKFFVQNLLQTEDGKKVLAYLKGRGIDEATVKEFEVGFVPDGKDQLYRHLLEQKCEKDDLLQCNLVLARDAESKQIMDRFRLRLLFPIADVQGRTVAFGGRALKKGDQPKYLNSAEYSLYHKGRMLYNLHRAKGPIRSEDLAVIVEGYFDVMASHQAGVPNVVATSGTALTEGQFKLLKRYTKNIALAFDSDAAGQAALLRAVQIAQPLGLKLYVVSIPGGKDAADVVKEDAARWVKAVEERQPYMDYFYDRFQEQFDLGDPEGKRNFSDSFLELLEGVEHPVEKDHYLKKLSDAVGTPVDLLYSYLGQLKNQRPVRQKQEEEEEGRELRSKQERLLEYFLGLVLAFPKEFFEIWERWKDFDVFSKQVQKIGMVQQLSRLNEQRFLDFYQNFETLLGKQESALTVDSVYKDLKDHYNLHTEIKEAFYASTEHENELRKLALQAEIRNPDPKHVPEEFQKVIALLYLELT